ncbi:hypothetical protein GPECTOR_184g267 [Gonium pectorale]|uniref:glutathione gamma-glutamylcysteinyltransferase n=1 Tax=Gonium pectorale TaxID=33097 RepID=A0A150FX88_GONPE|nr:hypothetical protein GPECTOR_184g267 [Gonium pectorale]|eukprot:KXZ42198.1 hypothetical protein GPECTOR_184g267 [Gonium pectorale]
MRGSRPALTGPMGACVVAAATHLPCGVLYDLLAEGEDGQLPWRLTVHYTHPPDSLVGWTTGGTPQAQFMNSLKEACYVCRGSKEACYVCRGSEGSAAVMRMGSAAQEELWGAVQGGDLGAYRAALGGVRLGPTSRQGQPANIPVRLLLRRKAPGLATAAAGATTAATAAAAASPSAVAAPAAAVSRSNSISRGAAIDAAPTTVSTPSAPDAVAAPPPGPRASGGGATAAAATGGGSSSGTTAPDPAAAASGVGVAVGAASVMAAGGGGGGVWETCILATSRPVPAQQGGLGGPPTTLGQLLHIVLPHLFPEPPPEAGGTAPAPAAPDAEVSAPGPTSAAAAPAAGPGECGPRGSDATSSALGAAVEAAVVGRAIFSEALRLGTMVGFFKLIEQFITQEEPQYCGLAALTMTLNALGVDPRRCWKGSWRWFCESMLDCCKSLDDIKRDGITINQARTALARCNGADVSLHRHGTFDGRSFRRLLRQVCAQEDRHMVVAYSRKAFLQSGDGHFSPIGGYHPGRDLVLILDVARFKYSPHWVRVDDLMAAMAMPDPATGLPRGFMLVGRRQLRESALFAVSADAALAAPPSPPCASSAEGATEANGSAIDDAAATGALHPAPDAPIPAMPGGGGAKGCSEAAQRGGAGAAAQVPATSGEARSCSLAEGSRAAEEAPWAAAVRFITADGPALLQRMIAAASPAAAAEGHDGAHGEPQHHDGDDEGEARRGGEEGTTLPSADTITTAVAGTGGGTGGGGVPSMEAMVEALVAAAPLESVCALLSRRPMAAEVAAAVADGAEPLRCCSCDGHGGAGAGGAGDSSEAAAQRGRPASGSSGAASPFLVAARPPCNAAGRGGVWPLTEAVVAAANGASQRHRPGGGSGDDGGGGDRAASATSSSSDSDAGTLESSGPSDSSSGSESRDAWSSGDACGGGGGGGSDEGDPGDKCLGGGGAAPGGGRCCHGEPLEHHCVPNEVQALVVEELRFTNAFKLQATAAAAAGSVGAAGGLQGASGATDCECGDLGLPELAAEKLAAALLLMPPVASWWPAEAAEVAAAAGGGDAAATGGGGGGGSSRGVRVCGRPGCRRCRQRAAAAGDVAAALALERGRWEQLLAMAPLGLFSSVPVLREEVAFLRAQLAALAPAAGP